MRKIGIMQPYFLPYIGYFQLIKAVDIFVIYDNIKYTKKGWINRNRFLANGEDVLFTIPLQKDSDFLDVKDRRVSKDFNKKELLNKIQESYKKAPFFDEVLELFKNVLFYEELNLFNYIYFSVLEICKYLDIKTKILISSSIEIDSELKAEEKVLAICSNLQATEYINTSGGQELYSKENFTKRNIELKFIKSKPIEYKQFKSEFVPWLSILDVMMFNSKAEIQKMLDNYELF